MFRDRYEALRAGRCGSDRRQFQYGQSHQRFAARHRLPFPLVSDADGSLRALYGVTPTMWVIPSRVTFLVDRQGIVRHICSSLFQAAPHVEDALRVLASLPVAQSWDSRNALLTCEVR